MFQVQQVKLNMQLPNVNFDPVARQMERKTQGKQQLPIREAKLDLHHPNYKPRKITFNEVINDNNLFFRNPLSWQPDGVQT